jgi:phosphatidylserine decarboxylase
MEKYLIMTGPIIIALAGGYLFWRYIWFFRNPQRNAPDGEAIVSPADGTVVYVKTIEPDEEVIAIKQGLSATINDIAYEDLKSRRILIGIFMSPFNVHYNRAPITGVVQSVRHYPAKGSNLSMWRMHLRTILNLSPYHKNSLHIVQNERTVTRFEGNYKGQPLSCYVIQIAARSVNGIDSYVGIGEQIRKGEIFGMIRIGSQVDIVVPYIEGMEIHIKPGDRVRAGEMMLIE